MSTFPERLSQLEKAVESVKETVSKEYKGLAEALDSQVEVINKLVSQIKQAFSVERDTMDAVVNAMKTLNPEFENAFSASMKAIKKAQLDRINEQEKAQLDQLVKTGQLIKSSTVSDSTALLVGTLKNSKTEEVLNPRVVVQLKALPKELADDFMGKQEGFEHFSKESDEKFVLNEMYDAPSTKEETSVSV